MALVGIVSGRQIGIVSGMSGKFLKRPFLEGPKLSNRSFGFSWKH